MTWGYVAVGAGTVVSGYLGSEASKDAAKSQAKGLQKGQDAQYQMFQEGQEATAPWRATGESALSSLEDIYGLSGYLSKTDIAENERRAEIQSQLAEARGATFESGGDIWDQAKSMAGRNISNENIKALEDELAELGPAVEQGDVDPYAAFSRQQQKLREGFETSPGQEYQLEQANIAAKRASSAQGFSDSGPEMKELQRIAQGQASQEWGNYLGQFGDYTNALRSMAGQGQTSAGQTATMSANAGTNMAAGYQQAGQVAAAADINKANVYGNVLSQGAQLYGMINQPKPSAVTFNPNVYGMQTTGGAATSVPGAYGMRPPSQIPVQNIA